MIPRAFGGSLGLATFLSFGECGIVAQNRVIAEDAAKP
jgi:hypothetical protein